MKEDERGSFRAGGPRPETGLLLRNELSPAGVTPSSLSSWTSGLLLGNELSAVLPVPGSTAASAVFIGAPPRNLLEPKRRARRTAPRARARVLPETTEALTREVLKLGDDGMTRLETIFFYLLQFASRLTRSFIRMGCQVGRGLPDPPRTSLGAPGIRTRRTGCRALPQAQCCSRHITADARVQGLWAISAPGNWGFRFACFLQTARAGRPCPSPGQIRGLPGRERWSCAQGRTCTRTHPQT